MILKNIFHRFVGIFFFLFALFLPFPFFIFPESGEWLRSLSESIAGGEVHADSIALYWLTLYLLFASLVLAVAWTFIWKKDVSQNLKYWIHTCIRYYLALILLKYGFDKIFLNQFYFPEANTIFTPVGQLSPDILYWTSMGTSPRYSIFAGIIEVIPALLLLFKRTKTLGALLSVAVLINVVMINFGFDISVKLFSLFLLGLSLYLIVPDAGRFLNFVQGHAVEPRIPLLPRSRKAHLIYSIVKPLIIALILIESMGLYFMSDQLESDPIVSEELVGAYVVFETITQGDGFVDSTLTGPKRIFIHSKSHFITESQEGRFSDTDLEVDYEKEVFNLSHDSGMRMTVPYYLFTANGFRYLMLQFTQGDRTQLMRCKKIKMDDLPIYQDGFHWTVEGAIEDAIQL